MPEGLFIQDRNGHRALAYPPSTNGLWPSISCAPQKRAFRRISSIGRWGSTHISPIVHVPSHETVAKETHLPTDESRLYASVVAGFKAHETTRHNAKEYVRGDVHSNSFEGYFGLFKRGMKGVYHHCDEKHLHSYLAEFDFRYNHRSKLGYGDIERTFAAIRGAEGKRLTYRQPDGAGMAA